MPVHLNCVQLVVRNTEIVGVILSKIIGLVVRSSSLEVIRYEDAEIV